MLSCFINVAAYFSNSGAVLNIDQKDFNLIRVGMLIYGAYPSNEVPKDIDLQPVMEFKAPIVEVRRVSLEFYYQCHKRRRR